MSNKVFDFNVDVKRGESGEIRFTSHIGKYLRIDPSLKLADVAREEEYQKMDIDFLLYHNQEKYALEFKTDSYDSGNMFYEEFSAVETNSAGCFQKTKANVILYYFSKTDTLYTIYNVNEFRKWYFANETRYRHSQIKNKRYDGSFYHAYGGLIPLKELEVAMEGKFGVKSKLLEEAPKNIISNIEQAVAFTRNEDIGASLKTTYGPMFKKVTLK